MKLSYLKHTCILAFALMCLSLDGISACAEENTDAAATETVNAAEAPQPQTETPQVQTEDPQVQTEALQTLTPRTEILTATVPETEAATAPVTGETAPETEAPVETQASSARVYAESEELVVSSSPDLTAGTETAAEWESTLPELTGIWRDDILNIARSQMGYKENTANYVTSGGSMKGYTRYGAWYGIPYGDWCAMFASFCIYYAGVPADQMPLDASTASWIEKLTKLGQYRTRASGYVPQAGDLIFFARDGVNVSHVGLVEEVVTDANNAVTQIVTIEGNSSNMVKYNAYLPYDTYILGYGMIPEQPADSISAAALQTVSGAITENDLLEALQLIKLQLELEIASAAAENGSPESDAFTAEEAEYAVPAVGF